MTSSESLREKIYFVVSGKHLSREWPELVSDPRPFAPDGCPERILSGRDCWVILTWARLCAADCPFEPVLSCKAVDNAVCVFHWDDATPAMGVHRCFAVVAQTDRPRPALSDMTVMQNGLTGETELRRKMPHWPQPGLIPRDPARGDRLETLAYFGSDQYEPHFVKTGAFSGSPAAAEGPLREPLSRDMARLWACGCRIGNPRLPARRAGNQTGFQAGQRMESGSARPAWPGTGLQGAARFPTGFSGNALGRGRAGFHRSPAAGTRFVSADGGTWRGTCGSFS